MRRYLIAGSLVFAACSSTTPMSSSLIDMTSETRSQKGELFKSSDILAINGLLPTPEVGLFYHYPPKPGFWAKLLHGVEATPPNAAIAISRDHSFRIEGTAEYKEDKAALEELRSARAERKLAKAADKSAEAKNKPAGSGGTPGSPESVPASTGDKPAEGGAGVAGTSSPGEDPGNDSDLDEDKPLDLGGQAVEAVATVRRYLEQIADLTAQQIALEANIAKVSENDSQSTDKKAGTGSTDLKSTQKDRDRIEDKLNRRRNQLNAFLATHRGIVIARWKTKSDSDNSLTAGDLVQASGKTSKTVDGFVVMAGIRVSMLAIGDDFQQLCATMSENSKEMFKMSAITTYVLQAESVAYVTAQDMSAQFQLAAKISKDALENPTATTLGLQSIKIQMAIDKWSSLGNSATIGPLTWRKLPFCFVAGHDMVDLDKYESDYPTRTFSDPPLGVKFASYERTAKKHYMTVLAHIVYPGALADGGLFWNSPLTHWADDYSHGGIPPNTQYFEKAPGHALKGDDFRQVCRKGQCAVYGVIGRPGSDRDEVPVKDAPASGVQTNLMPQGSRTEGEEGASSNGG